MKLDATDLRYISTEEFRVLTAVEMGSKNHEVVPSSLVVRIAGLRNGGVNKMLGELSKRKLVARVQNMKYDGFRLTYGGYDYLALRALSKRSTISSVGKQIGVGKESDIYMVSDANGSYLALKLHRLGRVSFRAIKEKRDYLGKRKSASWMYLSRLAAQKEWSFLKALHEHKFPVPKPVDQTRHCVLMELIDGVPLRQVAEHPSPGKLYSELMDLIVRFAQVGLIHGDFNEFNILIRNETGDPVIIDFPQMVSVAHENAEWYFNRDVECIRTFFRRRFRYESSLFPTFHGLAGEGPLRLDTMITTNSSDAQAMHMQTLAEYMEGTGGDRHPSIDCEQLESSSTEDFQDGSTESCSHSDEGSEQSSDENEESVRLFGKLSLTDLNSTPSSTGISKDLDKTAPRSNRKCDAQLVATSSTSMHSQATDRIAEITHRDLDEDFVRKRVAAEVQRHHVMQNNRYHSKKGVQKTGRQRGSKAKQDTRVKLDSTWD